MPVRFLMDENISPRVAVQLRRSGVDARSVVESDLAGSSDEAIFKSAIVQVRIVVTYNVADFIVLLRDEIAAGGRIPGVIFVSASTIPSSEIGQAVRALRRLASLLDSGEVDASGGIFLQGASD